MILCLSVALLDLGLEAPLPAAHAKSLLADELLLLLLLLLDAGLRNAWRWCRDDLRCFSALALLAAAVALCMRRPASEKPSARREGAERRGPWKGN